MCISQKQRQRKEKVGSSAVVGILIIVRFFGVLSHMQRGSGFSKDGCRLVDESLGLLPLIVFDAVANRGEEGLVVAGPTLGSEYDVSELISIGNLRVRQ